jgi:membrane-associated phospholipid phosphatase
VTRIVSSLGDAALLLPASFLLMGYLAVTTRWALLRAFGVAMGLGLTATVGAKLLFRACGSSVPALEIVSPSGHVSFAVLFYGCVGIMLCAGRSLLVRWAAGGAVAILVAAVGVSRVVPGYHSAEEVAFGFAIGAPALAVFAVMHARAGRPAVPILPFAVGLAAALLLAGGRHFTIEHWIVAAARDAADVLDLCEGPGQPGPRLSGLFRWP